MITNLNIPDAELISLINLKSREGVEVLYDKYAKVLLMAIFRIVKDKAVAETLLAQTLVQVWKTIGLYNSQDMNLLCWMLKIAKQSGNSFQGLHPAKLTA